MTGPANKFDIPNFDLAVCKGEDPELWFAEDTINPVVQDVELARAMCMACGERLKCLAWGLRNEEFGMWGGLTANERKHFKARRFDRLTHLDKAVTEGIRNGNGRIY